jgi:hypothetical protein
MSRNAAAAVPGVEESSVTIATRIAELPSAIAQPATLTNSVGLRIASLGGSDDVRQG